MSWKERGREGGSNRDTDMEDTYAGGNAVAVWRALLEGDRCGVAPVSSTTAGCCSGLGEDRRGCLNLVVLGRGGGCL